MSKATLWDVFDAAMGTAELVTGEIAKYKIEQDEAELRKFELVNVITEIQVHVFCKVCLTIS